MSVGRRPRPEPKVLTEARAHIDLFETQRTPVGLGQGT
jgi:hypothetical protein